MPRHRPSDHLLIIKEQESTVCPEDMHMAREMHSLIRTLEKTIHSAVSGDGETAASGFLTEPGGLHVPGISPTPLGQKGPLLSALCFSE